LTVTNNYMYAHNTVAVTAVTRETFVNGGAVARASVRVNAEDINHPRVMEARLDPGPRSAFGPAATARAVPPAALANRPVVTRMAPSPHAVALGHTQPLVSERAAYRPSTPPNGGQFGHPGPGVQTPGNMNANGGNQPRSNGNVNGNGQFHSFQPPSHNNANTNTNANGSNPPRSNSNDNGGYKSFQPVDRNNGNANVNGGGQSTTHSNVNEAGPQADERHVQGGSSGNNGGTASGAKPHENAPAEKPKPKPQQKKPEEKKDH